MDFGAALLYPFQWLVSAIMIGAAPRPEHRRDARCQRLALAPLHRRAGAGRPGRPAPALAETDQGSAPPAAAKPDLMKLQEEFKGKTDPLSRQAMAQEQMDLYKRHGTGPFSACLPALVQVPFLTVLSGIGPPAAKGQGLAAMSAEQVAQFEASSIIGAPLSASLLNRGAGDPFSVSVLAILMILAMTAAQFITRRHI